MLETGIAQIVLKVVYSFSLVLSYGQCTVHNFNII